MVEPAPLTGTDTVVLHTDGASRGNPGPAAIGVVITEPSGRVLAEFGEALQPATNNVAEYTAVIRGLERARTMGARRVRCLMDSQLVVRQLNGSYRVKHADMLPLYRRVLELIQAFEDVTFAHVPREQNAEADRLANLALDRGAASPDRVVEAFFTALVEQRWEDARSHMATNFRYRRISELDRHSFLEMWKKSTGYRWEPPSIRQLGSDVILEVTVSAPGPVRVLWICRVADGKVEELVEYQDTGS